MYEAAKNQSLEISKKVISHAGNWTPTYWVEDSYADLITMEIVEQEPKSFGVIVNENFKNFAEFLTILPIFKRQKHWDSQQFSARDLAYSTPF